MARNIERDQKLREDRSKAILKTAVELFALKGVAATKISEIAKKSGISHGLVYNYFQSKEGIVASLIHDNLHYFKSRIENVLFLPVCTIEKLGLLLDGLQRDKVENAIYSVMFVNLMGMSQILTLKDISAELQIEIKAVLEDIHHLLTELFREGQAAGVMIDGRPEQHAIMFYNMIGTSVYAEQSGQMDQAFSRDLLIYFVKREQQ